MLTTVSLDYHLPFLCVKNYPRPVMHLDICQRLNPEKQEGYRAAVLSNFQPCGVFLFSFMCFTMHLGGNKMLHPLAQC